MKPRVDPWLAAILALAVVLNGWHLTWGLPNGNASWAADAIGPVTALGVARHSFGGWNSGWFYFKYPSGWPFLMVLAFIPYLALLYASGGWRHPTADYPYGFAQPEHALFALEMIGRVLNVAFGVGTAAVAYGIAHRLLDRRAARWSAFLVATAYPIIYYSHTTNLDISYCFWLLLALYCAIVASGTDHWRPWVGLGIAAAMALSTKEQGFAFLLPLPFMALAVWIRRTRSLRVCWQAPTLWMLASGAVTLGLANNVIVNPRGFVARIAYLLGHPLGPVDARLAPVEFSLWKGSKELVYVAHLWDGMSSSLGLVLLALAAVGALAVWRRPRAALWLWVPTVALYYLSLRGLELITLRYLLPVTVIGAILIAGLLSDVGSRTRQGGVGWVVGAALAVVAALSLGRGVETVALLRSDARYRAEAWMATALPRGTRAEVYQKLAFLPRFRDGVTAEFVPIEQRTRAGVLERRPEAIVTSSASRKSITHTWAADWRETRTLLTPQPAAVDFLAALEGGELPYRVGGVFRQEPWLVRNRITSVAPEITIYVRND
jgi:dolichyl-phosphate-mannose-protein mannosyltransferase